MFYFILSFGLIDLFATLLTYTLVSNAPEGWQDEKGFHFGTPGKYNSK